jgi:hypothetical protein
MRENPEQVRVELPPVQVTGWTGPGGLWGRLREILAPEPTCSTCGGNGGSQAGDVDADGTCRGCGE